MLLELSSGPSALDFSDVQHTGQRPGHGQAARRPGMRDVATAAPLYYYNPSAPVTVR